MQSLPVDYYSKMNLIENELRRNLVDSKKKYELKPIPKSHLFNQILIKHKNENLLFHKEYQVNFLFIFFKFFMNFYYN